MQDTPRNTVFYINAAGRRIYFRASFIRWDFMRAISEAGSIPAMPK